MNITVLYSMPTRRAIASPYADTEQDTVESAAEVAKALESKGATVTLLPVDEDHIDRIAEVHADLIFNIIDWTGLDLPLSGRAFAAVEETRIPVTGATRANYMETSDKITMKIALTKHELPTARFQVFERGDEKPRDDFHYPVIIKPALEHCSIGLSQDAIVDRADALMPRVADRLKKFKEPMLVEEFIQGREFQVTVIETKTGPRVLPPAEIIFDTSSPIHMLTYDSRWDDATVEYKTSHVAVATLTPDVQKIIERVSLKTFADLGFRDYSRLDIRMRGRDMFILEANSNPGLSDDIEYGMTLSYRAVGWTFADFIWNIVESALRRATPLNLPE